jgi:hypothetical protein
MNIAKKLLPFMVIVLGPMAMLFHIWANPLSAGEDDAVYYYPLRVMAGQQLRQGHLPLANPAEATGVPLMADPQAAVMYPPTWLFVALNGRLAYSLSIFLAFSLAGIGAYLYLRKLGLRAVAALLGATAFMYCGFMVGHRVHLSVINTACYLPWGLWCIEMMRRGSTGISACADGPGHGTPRTPPVAQPGKAVLPGSLFASSRMLAFVWLAPVVYLALTAGHWPTFIYLMLIWCVYLALRGRPFVATAGVAAGAVAMAMLVASPQLHATMQLLMGSTRQRIGYATFGENSFFPPSAILGLFPMIEGSRTPNFFPHEWWGSWHLCEMLGYVGLLTLALAGAAVWKFYRKPKSLSGEECRAGETPATRSAATRSIVRVWTWIGAGAFIWMLGYYLPTYKLIHLLPVLNIVRCPARMVLALDMALATLAAVAVDRVIDCGLWVENGQNPDLLAQCRAFSRAVKRALTRVLPLAMVGAIIVFAAVAWFFRDGAGALGTQFTGSAWDAFTSFSPANPAVWVQFVLLGASVAGGLWWLRSPARRGPVLVAILLADLFMVTGFVDSPGKGAPVVSDWSPAAQWLADNAGQKGSYRIWGISENYHHRPDEMLLPKTCEAMGFESLGNYGPFQSPHHAHLFGFEIFGHNRDWESLLRKNYLLSMYNVKYIIASNPMHRQVLESVTIDDSPRPADGAELLTGRWPATSRVEQIDAAADATGQARPGVGGASPAPAGGAGPVLALRTPWFWDKSEAQQPVALEAGQVYRIALDACGPEGGAANCLRADIYMPHGGGIKDDWGSFLVIPPDQIGANWRHFEWVFKTPDPLVGPGGEKDAQTVFRVLTYSERAIRVANVSLRPSSIDRPINLGGKLTPGSRVYAKVAELPAAWVRQVFGLADSRDGCPTTSHAVQAAQGFSQSDQWAGVAIYENLLCRPRPERPGPPATHDTIESLKWGSAGASCTQEGAALPPASAPPGKAVLPASAPPGKAVLPASAPPGKAVLPGPDISLPAPAPSKWLLLAIAPGAVALHILLVGCVLWARRRLL